VKKKQKPCVTFDNETGEILRKKKERKKISASCCVRNSRNRKWIVKRRKLSYLITPSGAETQLNMTHADNADKS